LLKNPQAAFSTLLTSGPASGAPGRGAALAERGPDTVLQRRFVRVEPECRGGGL
jgi:hypothetical protein